MASVEGLKRRFKEWKPHVQSAFVVHITPRLSPIQEVDDSFEMIDIRTPDHPILPLVCTSKYQLRHARKAMAEGRWSCVVALKDGNPVGRIWQTFGTEKSLANGVPRMRLASDEWLMFDLFVERAYRRSGVGMTMAEYYFKAYGPDSDKKYGYGFIAYENAASILWHHSIGFQITQTMNYLAIGPYIKWKMPFSDVPRFGPMSRKGRHTDPDKELFGTPLFP